MVALGIVLLILVLLALLPLGVRVRYDEDGVGLWLKLWLVRLRLLPKKALSPREQKAKEEKRARKEARKARKQEKKARREAEKARRKGREADASAEEAPEKKGGALDAVRAALPLVTDALSGLKKRLTIRELELYVTWAGDDPADAAVGYGYAQAALGTLWALVEQNFKVKKSRLGCGVDFMAPSPTVYADATVTVRLGQVFTLVIPLLLRFLKNSSRVKKAKAKKSRKEA